MVPVLFVDNEIEAELARGRLESEGIRAQVRFSAGAGYPRYVAGYGGFGVGAPLSTYEVLVEEREIDDARRILGAPKRSVARARPWRRSIIVALTLVVLALLAIGASQTLRALF